MKWFRRNRPRSEKIRVIYKPVVPVNYPRTPQEDVQIFAGYVEGSIEEYKSENEVKKYLGELRVKTTPPVRTNSIIENYLPMDQIIAKQVDKLRKNTRILPVIKDINEQSPYYWDNIMGKPKL